jgi:hypothetical protein
MILLGCTSLTTLGHPLFHEYLLFIVMRCAGFGMSHINYRSLQNLCKEKMVIDLPMVSCKDGVCSGCVLEKHHRDSFDKHASWHTLAPLQLLHGDLCGPLPMVSFFDFKYFLTSIDDYSKRTWIYFLKLKNEVFNMFLAYKVLVEKQPGQHILKLRSDNGGEYVNNKFITFCTEQGIQMQHTVPYTPQQNGVVERKNRTLKEMANCMLQSKGLSLRFWAEAINCANYIVNRTPTDVLKNITPEEAWSSIKPDVSHSHVFGSEAWAHIPDEKHKALEPKSEKCIFVGYSEDVKGYRLLQPNSKEIIIRRDVKFNENVSACEPDSAYVPSSTCEPDLAVVTSSSSLLDNTPSHNSLDTDSDDENHPPLVPPPTPVPLAAPQLPDGSAILKKSLVILLVTLQISVEHVLSSREPLLYCLKFQKIMTLTHLQKPQAIHSGMQQ